MPRLLSPLVVALRVARDLGRDPNLGRARADTAGADCRHRDDRAGVRPAEAATQPEADTQKETDTTDPVVQPEPKPAVEQQPFTLTVTVAADGASWLRVTVDGKTAYEGVLTGGQSKEFEVTEKAKIRIGKPEVGDGPSRRRGSERQGHGRHRHGHA